MHTIARAIPTLTVGFLLMVGSAGCAATGAGRPPVVTSDPTASDSTSSQPSPTSVATTPPPAAADGTDLAACADGVCEVRIDGPTEIPVPRRGGLREVRVETSAAGLQLVVLGPSGFQAVVGGSGTTSLAEGAVVSMTDIGGGSAIVMVTVP